MASPHVLIIGAGLAGPAMALALARQKIRSTVFERRATSQDIGGVLMLAPNAVRVLDDILGIEPQVRKLGYTFDKIEMHGCSGGAAMERLGELAVAAEEVVDGNKRTIKGITVRRPALHEKLLELCEADKEYIDVQFGKRLEDIGDKDDGVTVRFEDGTQAEGDIVLGVDGIYSRVRQHVLGGAEAAKAFPSKYIGHVVLGGVISRSKLDLGGSDPPAFLYTPVGTILTFPTDPSGDSLQWAAFLSAPERDRNAWNEYRTSGRALQALRDEWSSIQSEPIKSMLDDLTSENMLLWAPYAIPELPTWHTKRVCLIGDAAHAISPSAGQGTAQALEDVGLMARLLGSPQAMEKGYEALFAHYEKARKDRLEGVREMTDRTLTSRAPSKYWASWWVKKMGFKVMLGLMSSLKGVLPRNNVLLAYDVCKESIEVS